MSLPQEICETSLASVGRRSSRRRIAVSPLMWAWRGIPFSTDFANPQTFTHYGFISHWGMFCGLTIPWTLTSYGIVLILKPFATMATFSCGSDIPRTMSPSARTKTYAKSPRKNGEAPAARKLHRLIVRTNSRRFHSPETHFPKKRHRGRVRLLVFRSPRRSLALTPLSHPHAPSYAPPSYAPFLTPCELATSLFNVRKSGMYRRTRLDVPFRVPRNVVISPVQSVRSPHEAFVRSTGTPHSSLDAGY